MPKKKQPITDAQRLAALEAFVRKEPLVLWDGSLVFPGGKLSGLSLFGGLRKALDPLVRAAEVERRKP